MLRVVLRIARKRRPPGLAARGHIGAYHSSKWSVLLHDACFDKGSTFGAGYFVLAGLSVLREFPPKIAGNPFLFPVFNKKIKMP